MKKETAALAIALSILSAAPALSAGRQHRPPADEGGARLEERKADILARIEQRISLSRKEEACVKAATTHEELRECREKFRPEPPPRGDRRDEGGRPPRGERPPADDRGPRGDLLPDADR